MFRNVSTGSRGWGGSCSFTSSEESRDPRDFHAGQSALGEMEQDTVSPTSPSVPRRHLCPEREQRRAAEAVEGLMATPVRVLPRVGQEELFWRPGQESQADAPLVEVLETLRAAAIEVAARHVGERAEQEAPLYLKGSLATAAIEGRSLVELLQEGRDLDLQLEADSLMPEESSDAERLDLAKRIVVLWVCSLLKQEEPAALLERMERGRGGELPGQIFRHFFQVRKAISPQTVMGLRKGGKGDLPEALQERSLSAGFQRIQGESIDSDQIQGDPIGGDQIGGDQIQGDQIQGDRVRRGQAHWEQDCWAIYGVRLELPEGAQSSLDLTISFRLKRPFLSDDSAFQVLLPLHGALAEAHCWILPRQALHALETNSFSVPQLQEVQRGALEKVLARMAKGALYRADSPEQRPSCLIEHFIASCQQQSRQDWRSAALQRLEKIPQPHWSASQRWALALQLAQIFPDWPDWRESEGLQPPLEALPESHALRVLWQNYTGHELADLLGALAPLLAGTTASLDWPPFPVWCLKPSQFLESWMARPGFHSLRHQALEWAAVPARGSFEGELVAQWVERLEESPSPGMDAQLILRLLALASPSAYRPGEIEMMAGRCLLEIADPTVARRLTAPWPILEGKCQVMEELIRQRRVVSLVHQPLEWRRELWVEALERWRHLAQMFLKWPHILLSPAGRQKAVWVCLLQCFQIRTEFPDSLVEEALTIGPPPGLQQSSLRVLLPLALQEGQPPERLQRIATMVATCAPAHPEALDGSALSRELRAWQRLLRGLCAARIMPSPKTLAFLQKSCQLKRWGESGTLLVVQELESIRRDLRLSGEQSIELAELAHADPSLWDLIPPEHLPALDSAAARACLSFRWSQKGAFSQAEHAVMQSWLATAQDARRWHECALTQGWPLTATQIWEAEALQIVQAKSRSEFLTSATRWLERLQATDEPPAPETQQQLEAWLQRMRGCWMPLSRAAIPASSLALDLALLMEEKQQSDLPLRIAELWWQELQRAQGSDSSASPAWQSRWGAFLLDRIERGWRPCMPDNPLWKSLWDYLTVHPERLFHLLDSRHPWLEALVQGEDPGSVERRRTALQPLIPVLAQQSPAQARRLLDWLRWEQPPTAQESALHWLGHMMPLVKATQDPACSERWLALLAEEVFRHPPQQLLLQSSLRVIQEGRFFGIECWVSLLPQLLAARSAPEGLALAPNSLGLLEPLAAIAARLSDCEQPLATPDGLLEGLRPMLFCLLGPDLSALAHPEGQRALAEANDTPLWCVQMQTIQPGLLAHLMLRQMRDWAAQADPVSRANLLGLVAAGRSLEMVLTREPALQVRPLARLALACWLHGTEGHEHQPDLDSPLWEAAATWASFLGTSDQEEICRFYTVLQRRGLDRIQQWCALQEETGSSPSSVGQKEAEGILQILELVESLSLYMAHHALFAAERGEHLQQIEQLQSYFIDEPELALEVLMRQDSLMVASWPLFLQKSAEECLSGGLIEATLRVIEPVEGGADSLLESVTPALMGCAASSGWQAHPEGGRLLLLASGLVATLSTGATLSEILEQQGLHPNGLSKAVAELPEPTFLFEMMEIFCFRRAALLQRNAHKRTAWWQSELACEVQALDEWMQRVAKAILVFSPEGFALWQRACSSYFSLGESVHAAGEWGQLGVALLQRNLLNASLHIERELATRFLREPEQAEALQELIEQQLRHWMRSLQGLEDQANILFYGFVSSYGDSLFAALGSPHAERGRGRFFKMLNAACSLNIPEAQLLLFQYAGSLQILAKDPAQMELAHQTHLHLQPLEGVILAQIERHVGNLVESARTQRVVDSTALRRVVRQVGPICGVMASQPSLHRALVVLLEGLNQIALLRPEWDSRPVVGWMAEVEKGLSHVVSQQATDPRGQQVMLAVADVPIPGVLQACKAWLLSEKGKKRAASQRRALEPFLERLNQALLASARQMERFEALWKLRDGESSP